MEEDWELLHAADMAILSGSPSTVSLVAGDLFEDEEDHPCDPGAIKTDYFALAAADPSWSLGSGEIDSGMTNANCAGNFSGGLSDGSIETGKVGIGGNSLLSPGDFSGLWSEGSPGNYEIRPEMEVIGEKGVALCSMDSESLILDEKIGNGTVDSQKSEIGKENSPKIVEMVEKEESSAVSSAGDQSVDRNFGEIGSAEAGDDVGIRGQVEASENKDSVEMEERVGRNGGSEIVPTGREKKEVVWFKLPLELLKLCASRVRPIWSIPIAAAILGVMMLGRRLYRMKRRSPTIPLKIALDDKKASQLMVRAAKLNEAFSVVKRVPVIRSSIPVGGSAAWPMLPLK